MSISTTSSYTSVSMTNTDNVYTQVLNIGHTLGELDFLLRYTEEIVLTE